MADGAIGASGEWCTIESDPGVFTSLISSFGVRNAELSELWSLDDDSLSALTTDGNRVYGLIFLFKWVAGHHSEDEGGSSGKPLVGDEAPSDLFFAKQVTTNACATQAILSVLMNSAEADPDGTTAMDTSSDSDKDSKLSLGPTLSNLKSFIQAFPPDLRGEAIGSSDDIRNAHNSFARKDAFLSDPDKPKREATEDDDLFHFVAYVPHAADGCVYELDGLRAGPIKCGTYAAAESDDNPMAWLGVARKAIQDRIEKYAASEVKFNLMAVVHDKRSVLNTQLTTLKEAGFDDASEEVGSVRAQLAHEEEKRKHWAVENARRQHNYLPFCVELIKSLAASGKLPEITKKANDAALEARKKMMAAKMEEMSAAAAAKK